jgi:5-(carboxyamino)imidazole ribonucleotide synthase
MSTSSGRRAHVGIIGAGQLARMTLQAAIPLGLHVRILAERPGDGAALVASDVVVGSPNDPAALVEFASDCDVVTFDHELVPPTCLDALIAAGACLRPSAATMCLAQNKCAQRHLFASLHLPVPPFRAFSTVDDIGEVVTALGLPIVLKAASGGYDGRGVWVADHADKVRQLAATLTATGIEVVAEQRVPIERELAILIARRTSGDQIVYPLVETIQVDGICREVVSPAPVSEVLAGQAEEIARSIAEASAVVGILAVEFFVAGGRLLVNEIASRPHNSGHYSIEGCVTSQFEQHLRAILDWPLGATTPTAPAVVTVNVLGGPTAADPFARLPDAVAIEGAHVHLYGKGPRPGRKLGHVTVCAADVDLASRRARAAAELLSGASVSEEVRR